MVVAKNIDLLLKGKILLQEIKSENEKFRTWIEISLQDELRPEYPMRTDLYAMLGHSKYQNSCAHEKSKFKARTSSFLTSDIINDFDPSYDWVGEFFYFNSIEGLEDHLKTYDLTLEAFSDASFDDEYPL